SSSFGTFGNSRSGFFLVGIHAPLTHGMPEHKISDTLLDISSALEIERRPRGASLASQLPHLFRASYVCGSTAARLGACLKSGETPVVPTPIPSRTNKADSGEITGVTGPKQMWELACQRCAARAALDLKGAGDIQAGTCQPTHFLKP
ncbi:hypothetical protein, partial [Pseudomonas sichuanensis]